MAHRRREGSQRRSAGSNRRSQKVNRYQQTQKGPGSQLRSPGLFACLTCWLLLYSLLYGFLCRSLLCCCLLCRSLLRYCLLPRGLLRRCLLRGALLCCCFLSCPCTPSCGCLSPRFTVLVARPVLGGARTAA